jgi:PHD/YefM family antitoxin component YafN of YafNO toxin-antitoxin module
MRHRPFGIAPPRQGSPSRRVAPHRGAAFAKAKRSRRMRAWGWSFISEHGASGPWITDMRLASSDFIRNFGKHSDAALEKPLVISRNERDRLVMMNVDLYRELLDAALARKDRRAEPLQARLRKAREELQSRD